MEKGHEKSIPPLTLANYGLGAKCILLSVLKKKILLAHSHAHVFTYCLWFLLHCGGRVV